jgi:hypothetical protein
MAAYLLNLVFGKPAAAASATGLFTPDDPTGLRSKVWYTVGAGWPSNPPSSPGMIQESAPVANWGTPTPDSSLSCALLDGIYIRVVPSSSWGQVGQPVPNLSMSMSVSFGRPAGSNHGGSTLASPFTMTYAQGNGMNTPFTFLYSAVQTTPAPDGSWIFYCGPLSQNAPGQKAIGGPSDPTRFCTYDFITGLVAVLSSDVYTYGHDPSLVVKG